MCIVVVKEINKSFSKVKALSNINFQVRKGETFGIIGPDGAGKTTLFDIMVTLIRPDSGTVSLWGIDNSTKFRMIRSRIGYMPGRFSLYPDLTVWENLLFFANIFGTNFETGSPLIREIWQQLEPFKNRYAGHLSGGMKQKLALCCALIHKPEILFLDEPTTGIDAIARKELWHILKRLKEQQITTLVSTPYMDEAYLCDRVALIQQGQIMIIDTPDAIIDSYNKPLYAIRCQYPFQLCQLLNSFPFTHSCYSFGESVHLTLKQEYTEIDKVREFLSLYTTEVYTITPIKATIEDCFIELMTKSN